MYIQFLRNISREQRQARSFMVWTSVKMGECQRVYETFHFEDYVDIFHKTYQSTGGSRAVTEGLIS